MLSKNFQDYVVPVQGHFKIEKVFPDGSIETHYEDHNQIMLPFASLIANAVAKRKDEISPSISVEDIEIIAFAMGTDGVKSSGTPKTFPTNRRRLFSEYNFWYGSITNTNADMKSYVYQITFEQNNTVEGPQTDVTRTDEGATFPVDNNGNPIDYRGHVTGTDSVKMTAKTTFQNNILSFEFVLGQFAGNGIPDWTVAPTFSEAALYGRRGANSTTGNPLGTIIAMKTFPALPKTDTCAIRVKWDLNFSLMK